MMEVGDENTWFTECLQLCTIQNQYINMEKKAFLLTLLVIGISLNAIAQEKLSLERKRYKSVYLEFLGASNLIGISYDSRLSPTSHWGYRIGISY